MAPDISSDHPEGIFPMRQIECLALKDSSVHPDGVQSRGILLVRGSHSENNLHAAASDLKALRFFAARSGDGQTAEKAA